MSDDPPCSRSGSRVLNAFNQQTSTFQQLPSPQVTTSYAYDNNGNLLTETTGSNIKAYTWDVDNRLRQLMLPGTGGTHSYEYDSSGLRTKKVTPTGTTRYLLDGPTVLEELDSLGNATTSYLWDPTSIDNLLAFQKNGATWFPLTDALGSIVAITDSTGAVVRSCQYDAFGSRTCTGSGPDIAFGFTGREHDASGLRYHRDRYADPATGRWQQPDRLGMVDGPNLYQYAKGNPAQLVDPDGKYVAWTDPGLLPGLNRLEATATGLFLMRFVQAVANPVYFYVVSPVGTRVQANPRTGQLETVKLGGRTGRSSCGRVPSIAVAIDVPAHVMEYGPNSVFATASTLAHELAHVRQIVELDIPDDDIHSTKYEPEAEVYRNLFLGDEPQ